MTTLFPLNKSDEIDDGKLGFEEFLTAIWIRPVFNVADKDKSGLISSGELQAYFQSQNKKKMAAIFALNKNDGDGDRKINMEEFKAIVYLRPLFDAVDKDNKGT